MVVRVIRVLMPNADINTDTNTNATAILEVTGLGFCRLVPTHPRSTAIFDNSAVGGSSSEQFLSFQNLRIRVQTFSRLEASKT